MKHTKKLFIGMCMIFLLILVSSFASATTLDNGTVAYFKLDEISGTNAVDSVAGLYNGTKSNILINNGLGIINTGANISQNNAINFGNVLDWNGQTARTWNFWYNPKENRYDYVFSKQLDSSTYRGHQLIYDKPNNRFTIDVYNAISGTLFNQVYFNVNLPLNTEMHMISLVIPDNNANNYKLYVNGTLITSKTISRNMLSTNTASNTATFNIGGRDNKFSILYSVSDIDEFGIWDRALNLSEITELYDAQVDGFESGQYPTFGDVPTPNASAGDITAYDTKNSDFLLNFTVTLPNGTTITTTNGTASYEWNLNLTHNFTVSTTGFYNESYTNINMSEAYQSNLTMFTGIGARDIYTNTSIPINSSTIQASETFLLGSQIENGDVNKVYFRSNILGIDNFETDFDGWGTYGASVTRSTNWATDGNYSVYLNPQSGLIKEIDFTDIEYIDIDINVTENTAQSYVAIGTGILAYFVTGKVYDSGNLPLGVSTLRINTTEMNGTYYLGVTADSGFPSGSARLYLDNIRYYSETPEEIQFNITQEGYYFYQNSSDLRKGESDFIADLQQFKSISARNIYTNATIPLNTSVVSANNGVLYNGADILNGNTSRVYINTGSSFTDITINIPLHDVVTYTQDIRQTGTDLLADVRPFTVLKINGTQLTTNTAITTFNTTIRNSTGSIIGTYSTTNGSIFVQLTQGLYNVSFDSSAHEFQTKIVNVSGQTTNTSFSVFTTNSVQITYRDAVTNNLIVGNITVEFVSDLVAYNFTTSNASLYVDLLSPASYILRSTVTSYDQNTYFFILANRTYNNLTVYLTNSSDTTEVTIKVVDSVDNQPLQDYIVKVLKFSPGSNTYIVNEILQTNFEGEVVGDILLGSEFYRFIIENLQGDVVESTDPAYIYKTSLTISVNIAGAILEDYTSLQGLSGSLIYNPDTESFRYTYSDSSNTLSQVCVRVKLLQGITVTDYSETCASTSSGVIVSPINATNGTTYIASAYANFENGEIFLTSLTQSFSSDIVDDSNWLFYAAIITMGLILLTLWNPMIMVMVIPLPTLIFTIAGFIPLPLSVVVGMTMVFWVVAGYLGAKFK